MNVDGLKLNDDKTEFMIIGSRHKLNDNKTEFMIIGSRQQLEKVSVAELSVGDISVAPASAARNLGVLFDRNLKFMLQLQKHVVHVTTIYTI